MPAEISLQDSAVLCPVENRAPCLEFANAVRSFFGVELGHPPVVDILAAAHRVGKMHLPIIAVIDVRHRRRHAALGHYGVGLAEQRFADQARRETPAADASIAARKSRTAGTDDENVVFECCNSVIKIDLPQRTRSNFRGLKSFSGLCVLCGEKSLENTVICQIPIEQSRT